VHFLTRKSQTYIYANAAILNLLFTKMNHLSEMSRKLTCWLYAACSVISGTGRAKSSWRREYATVLLHVLCISVIDADVRLYWLHVHRDCLATVAAAGKNPHLTTQQ